MHAAECLFFVFQLVWKFDIRSFFSQISANVAVVFQLIQMFDTKSIFQHFCLSRCFDLAAFSYSLANVDI